MKIKFLGAAGQVTGSSFLLTAGSGESILIDCGMFQGARHIQSLNREPLQYNVAQLDGVVLTHAHLDHCGRLPLLVKNGFTKTIWMTPPTKDITDISLFDTAHINEEDNTTQPLYNKDDVIETIELFKTIDYRETFRIGSLEITFRDAGHIIGSASVEVVDVSSPGKSKIVFSGDLGNSPEDLIKPTEIISSGNSVVIETTYGDRIHEKEDVNSILSDEINEVEKTGGALLIPTFSIERSQEIVHRLSHLKSNGVINPDTLVYFDSPMGEKVTEVFENYTSYYNQELLKDIESYDPFHFPGIYYTKNSQQSRSIAAIRGPKIIIAGSGMMTGGRIINHAKVFLPMDTTRLLFVGYQAEATLGRQLLEGAKTVRIDHQNVEVNAIISQINSLSSHADQPRLLAWLKNISGVSNVFLVHGEDVARDTFATKIKSQTSIPNIFLPKLNEEVEIK